MDFVIRLAEAADLADINRCDNAFIVTERLAPRLEADGALTYTFEAIPAFRKAYAPEGMAPADYLGRPDGAVYLAYAGGELAGQMILATHWNGYAYVDDLRVAPAFRRQGLARRLLARAVEWTQARRLPGIMLETQDINAAACRLYASFGFVLGGLDHYLYRALQPPLDETALFWYLLF